LCDSGRKKKTQNFALWGCIMAFVVDLHRVYFVNGIQLEFKEFGTLEANVKQTLH